MPNTTKKYYIIIILGIILIGLFTLWPSFKLALTGDDYLTLWRYQQNVGGLHINPFLYFFTDYGPQDSLFALIHHYFSFNPLPYFTISFILRSLAAFSFYPLLRYISKNRFIPLFGVLFFLTNTAGLETTNWVFNMPSYLSISVLNFFLLLLIQTTDKFTIKHLLLTGILFALTIIFQPIRMIFLPGFAVVCSVFWLFYQFANKKPKKYPLIMLFSLLVIFFLIFLFTHIGDGIGVSTNFKDRITDVGLHQVKGVSGLSKEIANHNFILFLYPIALVGNVIIPNTLLIFKTNMISNAYIVVRVILPGFSFAIFFIYLATYKFTEKMKSYFLFHLVLLIFWTLIVFYLFRIRTPYPMLPKEIQAFLSGGYFLIFVSIFYFSSNLKNKKIIFFFLLLLILSFIVPWIINPHLLLATTGRYFIVPAVGATILIISLYTFSKNKLLFFIFIIIPLLYINIKASRLYLHQIAFERNAIRTESIRKSFPIIPALNEKGETTIFYFQTDNNEVLYHSLMFGFPVITSYYQKVDNIWNVAYTQNWEEVESAYTTGESLQRFGIFPIKPIPLENIYSFRLDYDHLVDTTIESRNKLLAL